MIGRKEEVDSGAARILSDNIHIRDLFSLTGRVALVTGGSGRYGRQISLALAEAGATVIIASRNVGKCVALADELRASNFDAHAMTLDLTKDDSVKDLAAKIVEKWDGLDILFNNAVTVSTGSLDKYSVEEWERVMACNSTGLYRACLILGGLMIPRRSGNIVNVASIYGVIGSDFNVYQNNENMASPPSYAFAKGGMIQLTRYLASYFARYGIRVNCLSPGGLYSPEMPKQFVRSYCARTPLGRMAGPNDIKGAAVFLASDASTYITGQNLVVDGGYTIL